MSKQKHGHGVIAELTAFMQVQAHVVEHNLSFW